MSASPPGHTDTRLLRGISRWGLLAFAVNLTVGAGILGLPGRIQALVGNYSVLVIVGCGLLMALVGLCFAEVASRFDRSGGPQLYASVAMGPVAGFLVGWLLWISRAGSCAVASNLLVDYATVLWPPLGTALGRGLIIAAVALCYLWVNVRGIRQTAVVSTVFTVCKVLPLVAFVAVGMFFVDPQVFKLGALPGVGDLSNAVLLAAFAFFGFDSTSILAGEVRDPARSVPFALLLSVSGVLVLYALIQIVCIGALPDLAASQRPLADAAVVFVGPAGGTIIAVTAVIACAGVYGASVTPGTRLLYAMADHGQIPTVFAQVHSRFRTPIYAIVVTSLVVLALALSGSFIYLVKITLISRISVYALTCATLPLLRRRHDLPRPPFVLRGGSVLACVAATCCILFLANSSMRELLDVGLAAAVGLILFAATRIGRRRPALRSASDPTL
jgi:APA family basic amino acid/polyamine antiporter